MWSMTVPARQGVLLADGAAPVTSRTSWIACEACPEVRCRMASPVPVVATTVDAQTPQIRRVPRCRSPRLRSTPRCSTRAKERALRLPRHQRLLLADPERRAAGFAEAESDGIIQVSTGGAEYLSGPTVKNMVAGSFAFAAYAARGRQELPGERRAAHRPLPQGQARRLRPAADRRSRGAGRRTARTPLFQSHMWDGSAVPLDENLQIAEELLEQCAAAQDHPRDRGRRRRRRGGRRRRRDQREAVHHPRGRARDRGGARHSARRAAT